MNELVVIVEGETEQTFVRDQLASHLVLHNTTVWPVLPGRNRHHGGVKKWKATRENIMRILKKGRYYSTMFDYYAMPLGWPGRAEAASKPWNERASIVEKMIHDDITAAMGGKFNPKFFIPYVQLHEFEALVFADVDILVSVLTPLGSRKLEWLHEQFTVILNQAGHPEAINDGYETCPSRRISCVVPAYKKRALGPIVTSRIGSDVLRARCTHFGAWLGRIEQLADESL